LDQLAEGGVFTEPRKLRSGQKKREFRESPKTGSEECPIEKKTRGAEGQEIEESLIERVMKAKKVRTKRKKGL